MVNLRSSFKLKLFLISILLVNFIWASLSINTVNKSISVSKSSISKLEIAKQTWLAKADYMVEAERDKLLAAHGLTSNNLISQPLVIEIYKFILGFITAIGVGVAKHTKSITNTFVETEITLVEIQQLANEIFVGPICKHVEILNSNICEAAICEDYRFSTCYLMLNQSFFIMNLFSLSHLRAVLQHEYAHILYEDNFKTLLLKLTIWFYSKQSILKQSLETDLYPLRRACETRADIYAAVNSPDHGLKLMEFLEKVKLHEPMLIDCNKTIAQFKLSKKRRLDSVNCSSLEAVTTHPATNDRIKLLKQIKTELNIAAKK